MIEIRWHGRGGQGAKTASLLLADIAFATGLYVQGFPEYGPERMGAPITAYNRLDTQPIVIHSNIYNPGLVVVVDETLMGAVDVAAGILPGGAMIINAAAGEKPREKPPGFTGHIYTVDASGISQKYLGRNLPNAPLLAAVVRTGDIMDRDAFLQNMEASFAHKFASKPEVIKGNMQAVTQAWEEVVKQ